MPKKISQNISDTETKHIEKSDILEKNIDKKNLTPEQIEQLENIISGISSAWLEEFMEYIRSPWRMIWPNFIAGVARGVGALVGAAVVIALIGWILSKMISLPLIWAKIEPYINEIQTEITKYTESTNYSKNFEKMETVLMEIRDSLRRN